MLPPDIPPNDAATPEPQAPAAFEATRTPDLLSSVCHDLRAPLASIMMGAGFLRRALSPEDLAARGVVEAIHRAADGMSQAITMFSDLARLEMHDLTLEIGSHDIGAIVQSIHDELVAAPSALDVPIALELEPGLPMLPCDKERVAQILRQLAAAALRVTPDRGSLLVRVATHGSGSVRVEVIARRHADAGSRRITTEPPKPALALARGLVELHGGSLAVAGDPDTFTISIELPLDRVAPAVAAAP
jgi:signal transduction histidine kinase